MCYRWTIISTINYLIYYFNASTTTTTATTNATTMIQIKLYKTLINLSLP